MKITVKKLSELHKPAHNIRRHSEKQLTEYIRSIEMFGQVKPLVVAEDGEIIAGNGLYEALLRMGRETCDCARGTHLLEPMKAIVKKLIDEGKTVEEIGKQLGMKPEEIFRLSGFTKDEFLNMMTKGHDTYSKAQVIRSV